MERSPCWIKFVLFALVFMTAFQQTQGDDSACNSLYRVGTSATFTYTNNSALVVVWKLLTATKGNITISCSMSVCENSTELDVTVTPEKYVLTILQMQTIYRSLNVVVDGVETPKCAQFTIFEPPANFSCQVLQSGSSTPTISYQAKTFFPREAVVKIFTLNGTLVYQKNITGFNRTGNQLYEANETVIVDSRFFSRGNNTFSISMTNGNNTNDTRTNCSQDIYPIISNFTVNGQPYTTSVPLNSTINLVCSVGPVPAENITLSRRGTGAWLNTTVTGTSVTYMVSAFGCRDLDEYVCKTENSTEWRIGIYTTCPPVTKFEVPNNVTLTANKGGVIFLPFKVISYSSVSANLWFIEDGVQYKARSTLFTTYSESTSTYFYNYNVALFDLRDSDFRDYILILNNTGKYGFSYYFTASQKTSIDVRGAAIGVGVVAIALLIVVVALVLVVCSTRRQTGRHHINGAKMDKTQAYDSTEDSWEADHKSSDAVASKDTNSSLPKRAITKPEPTYEEKYEPITEHSKPHRPGIPTPEEEIYEIDSQGNSTRSSSYYGNVEQPIYGNV